jgi:chromosome segregation ATPase
LKRIQQQTELEERNRELQLKRGEERRAKVEAQTELEKLRRDYAITKSQLQAVRDELEELRSQISIHSDPAYDADVVALRNELKAEIERFKQTENSLRGSDTTWQMRVTALKPELEEANAKLLRQYDINRKLEREVPTQSPSTSDVIATPPPIMSTGKKSLDTTNYNVLGIRELKLRAKAAKIKNYGVLTKSELIAKLTKN